ncbi:MAG: hypothetical protein J0H74_13875 [Chitinophagaceae bacterium]|nr:hypothetical protein [Chitinophagaceae bacterium]
MFIYLKPGLPILAVAVCLGLCSSCKKDRVSPEPGPGNRNISVELDRSYIGALLVDSAVAIWEISGQQTQVLLQKNGDTLHTDMQGFQPGNGTLTIKVFSKLKFGVSYLSQWVFSRQLTLSGKNGLVIAGPKSFSDEQWKPRVELKDGIGHFSVVALRPDDPYFFVKDVPDNLNKIVVARDYWKQGGGVFRIGGGEWQCTVNCRNGNGHIENREFFSFLPAQIGTASWNHIEITILYVEDEWGGGAVLSMTHTL